MKFNKSKAKHRLDKLFSNYIHNREHETCQMCGKKTGRMNTSHNISRSCLALRWHDLNASLLCYRCHTHFWHSNPLIGAKWFVDKYGQERINYLIKESELPYTFTEAEYLRLLIKYEK